MGAHGLVIMKVDWLCQLRFHLQIENLDITMSIRTKVLAIPASDGFELAATWFEFDGAQEPAELIIINSATGVRRGFYNAFAEFLVESGYQVLTYDYRGIGDSCPASLRGFEAKFQDWGLLDMNGAIEWAKAKHEPKRLFVVGHSVGGQLMGMISAGDKVDGMVTTSAQSGYWGVQGGYQKVNVLFSMYILFPVLTHLFGYFPWSKLRSGEDLPKGAALEWARWCRDPKYLLGDSSLPLERFAKFSAPILAYSFDDDNWGTEASVNAMMKAYPHVTRRHIFGKEYGINNIGHFGYFRPKSRPLWEETVCWLQALV